MLSKQCKSCGGNLKFSPKHNALVCEKCESIQNINIKKEYVKHEITENDVLPKQTSTKSGIDIVNCNTCGAGINLKGLEYSGVCPYCGSSLVIASNSNLPDAIIPFSIDIDNVKERYKQSVRKKWFIPNKFKKNPPAENISAVYLPSFAFDANTVSIYSGVLESSHTDKDGHTHTSTQRISGTKNINFVNEFVESSSKIDQLMLEAVEPFDTNKAVAYSNDFILGYSAEHNDQNVYICHKLARQSMNAQIKSSILSKYSYDRVRSFTCNTNFSNEKYSYFLVPTYKIDFSYKDKKYTTYMNGQTGKVGLGLPSSTVKKVFFGLGIALIIITIIVLVMLFGE